MSSTLSSVTEVESQWEKHKDILALVFKLSPKGASSCPNYSKKVVDSVVLCIGDKYKVEASPSCNLWNSPKERRGGNICWRTGLFKIPVVLVCSENRSFLDSRRGKIVH